MEKRSGFQFHQMTAKDIAVDSKEGMEIIVGLARSSGLVLEDTDIRMAKKHGVQTRGVAVWMPAGKNTNDSR